jgi:hypothetical protein
MWTILTVLGQHQNGFRGAKGLKCLQIQVVTVIVGDENHIGLGEFGEVPVAGHGIHVDHLPAEGEEQCAVGDKGDLKVTGRGRDDIPFAGLLGSTRRRKDQDQKSGQKNGFSHSMPPPMIVVHLGI